MMTTKEIPFEDAIQLALDHAKKQKGVTEAEAFVADYKELGLEIEKGRPAVTTGLQGGCSVRVLCDNNIGFAFTTALSEDGIRKAVEYATGNARCRGPDDIELHLPRPSSNPVPDVTFDPKIRDLDADNIGEFYDLLRDPCESSKLNFLGAQLGCGSGTMAVRNTEGVDIEQPLGFVFGGAYLLSMKGLIPAWALDFGASRQANEIDWTKVGESCVSETKRLQAPKTINYTGTVPVIFEPGSVAGIMGGLVTVLLRMLHGDRAFQGATYYADRLGEEIAVQDFSMFDDATHPKGVLSLPYDAEGTPSTRLPLIENGVLKNFLFDTYYAAKMDTESNGKCTRGFQANPVKTPPNVGTTNTIITPGDSSYEEMVSETQEGFSLYSVMGVHMSDFSSGRFAVTGSGHFIKGGKIKHAVQDVTVSGTVPDWLKKIDMIGKKPKFGLTSIVPPLRVTDLTVSARKMGLGVRFALAAMKTLTTLRLMKNPIVAD